MTVGASTSTVAATGWATDTLRQSLWRGCCIGGALWLPALAVLVAAENRADSTGVVVAAVAVAVLGVLGVLGAHRSRLRLVPEAFSVAVVTSLCVDLVVAEAQLSLAAVCMSSVVLVSPILMLPRRRALLISAAAALAAVTIAAVVHHDGRIVATLAVIAVCYTIGIATIATSFHRAAAVADREIAMAEREGVQFAESRSAAHARAEYSRTLHDTAINTLSAIGSGTAALTEPAVVRQRCDADLAALTDVASTPDPGGSRIDAVVTATSLPVVWIGMDAAERVSAQRQLSGARVRAVAGILRELLRNVERHADADQVTVDVTSDDAIVKIVVTDDGDGFPPDTPAGFGLAESVHARAAESGLRVDVASNPGEGTSATIWCPIDDDSVVDASADVTAASARRVTDRILYAGAWSWSAAIGVSNVVLAAVGGGGWYSMAAAAIVVVAAVACWVVSRHDRPLPVAVAVAVAGALPVAFVFGFLGVEHGGTAALWPGVGLTPLLVILLVTSATPAAFYGSGVGLVAACALCAGWWASTPMLAKVAVVNLVIHLAQMFAWTIYAVSQARTSERAADEHRSALETRADRVSLAAGRAAQERWKSVGVASALELLHEIADGTAAVDDPEVQRRAAATAHFLRQMLLISPDLGRIGPWLAQALDRSRRRDVRLDLRMGSVDVPDAATAEAVGAALLRVVDEVAPRSELTVAYFGDTVDPALTVVGPVGSLAGCDVDGLSVAVTATETSDRDMLTIVPRAGHGDDAPLVVAAKT